MSKPVELTEKGWSKLYDQLRKEHPPSIVLNSVRKKKLGFFTRRHYNGSKFVICLDFYDEKKRTFFLLKYSDYINE